jgi:hypothetical protein
MAKAKKRVPTRKKGSRRRKASAKATRKGAGRKKKAAKRRSQKKAKPKVRRSGKSAPKSVAKKKRRSKTATRKASKRPTIAEATNVLEIPVEATIIDVIEEPAPGVFVVTEYESVRTGPPNWPGREPKRGNGPGTEEQ